MPGLLRGVARTAVVAGTATAVSNGVSRRQQGRWERKAEEQQPQQPEQAPAPAPAPAAPAEVDMDAKIEQLQKLADLKTQGILSEAEFEAQKAKILG
jgi:Short C-terminal domain